ncbi:anti-anti-sigma factor [compost metagenome]
MARICYLKEADRTLLAVQGELNIYHAARLKDELLEALASQTELEVDLGEVEDCDSSGVQLLLLLKREARRQDKRLSLVNHSACVADVIELLNLVSELGDPLVLLLDSRRAHA